jgi:hypothetical protein
MYRKRGADVPRHVQQERLMLVREQLELYRGGADWRRELGRAVAGGDLERRLKRGPPRRSLMPHPSPMMLNAISGFGSRKAWRLQIDSNAGGATRTTLVAIVFKDSGGNVIPTTGGTAFSGGSGSDEVNGDVPRAFDSNAGTTWSRSSTTNTIAGYIFSSNVAVATVEMVSGTTFNTSPAVCRLQYSDNTTTGLDGAWTTAFEIWEPSWAASAQTKAWPQILLAPSYKAFRLNITASNDASFTLIQEIEMRATVAGADQCNNGLAFGSQANVNEEPIKAFDNADGNNYDLHIPVTGTIGYYMATAMAIAQYTVKCNNTNSRTPKTWDFQGSNDPTGASWTTLHSAVNQSWAVPETKSYTI